MRRSASSASGSTVWTAGAGAAPDVGAALLVGAVLDEGAAAGLAGDV